MGGWVLVAAALAAGCSGSGGGDDLATDDLASADLSASSDLAMPQPDLAADFAVLDGPEPDLTSAGDDGGVSYLDLTSALWSLTNDVGESSAMSPSATLSSLQPDQATVSIDGTGSGCTCNAQHVVLALPKSFDCSGASVEFTYTTALMSADDAGASQNTSSVLLKMLDASGGEVGFFSASEQSGPSSCAVNLDNGEFPATPILHEGINTIDLFSLQSGVDGVCIGTFTQLDVALEGWACASGAGSVTSLSNLRVY